MESGDQQGAEKLSGVGPGFRLLDRYEIVRHVGSGGMGTVWEARDLKLDQTVALKNVGFAGQAGTDAEQSRLRTLREARFAAQLRGHPHVVAIYDVQEAVGDVWLVLEYLPSRSLAEITRDGETLDVAEVARIGSAVAGALAAAHERGIIHRDVKPANVLLGGDGQVKLTDFGISHAEGEQPLTSTNVVSGTPAYMSREVARGDPETPASDVFSLGATLYRLVEGQPPFGENDNQRRLLQRVANGYIGPPQRAGAFTPLLMHLLELDPAHRPDAATAQRLLDGFARQGYPPVPGPVTGGPPPTAVGTPTGPPQGPYGPPSNPYGPRSNPSAPPPRRRRRAVLIGVAVVVALALLGGGIVLATRTDPTAVPPLPSSVPETLAMRGNAKDADACALFDEAVMGRFGQPTRIGPGTRLGECRLTNRTAAGDVYTEVSYATSRSRYVKPEVPIQDLGGLRIGRAGIEGGTCTTTLAFRDDTLVVIDTRPPKSDTVVPNLCEMNEAAVAVATNRLAEVGVVTRPGWQGPLDFGDENACRLLDAEVRRIPGLDAGQRIGYPSGALCFIGANLAGRPYVVVRLGLEPTGDMSAYGKASTQDGVPLYTDNENPYSPNPNACTTYAVHKGNYDGGASGPTEHIDVTVEGTGTPADLCAQATSLALAANRNASD